MGLMIRRGAQPRHPVATGWPIAAIGGVRRGRYHAGVFRRRPPDPLPADGRPAPSLRGLTIRAALALGLGATLVLWLATGYRMTRQMESLEARSSTITTRYMRAQAQLSTVRAHVLLGSVLVRDALLDPNPATARTYRKRFEETYAAADRALQEYEPVLGHADERDRLASLRVEIDEFRDAMLAALDAAALGDADQPGVLLQRDVMPQREVALRVSEQVQTMNREAFVQHGTETTAVYRESQRNAWTQLGVALVLSVAIGVLAAAHAGRLERRIGRQRVRDQQLTSDLQRLSTRLVSLREDERRSIARELHDEVGQALAAVKVELALAQQADAADALTPRLARVQSIAEDTLQRIRTMSHLLHPSLLDDLGLEAALEAHLRGVERRHGMPVTFTHVNAGQRLAPELETAVYRAVQEAVTNVVTHARATRCDVRLEGRESSVRVTVEDDGSGFDPAGEPAAGPRAGLGLISIRERVAQFGGAFHLESAPGRGTRLTIELPARPAPRDDRIGARAAAPLALSHADATDLPRG